MYLITLVLSLFAIFVSLLWAVNEGGYEPWVVLITGLIGIFSLLIKYRENNEKYQKLNFHGRGKSLNEDKLSHIEVSKIIKKYDLFYYNSGKYYTNIVAILLSGLLLLSGFQANQGLVENYEKYLNGEVGENFNQGLSYNENGELISVEEYKIQRTQVVLLISLFLPFFLIIVVKPTILSLITKRLRKKLEFIDELDEFEMYSVKINKHLENYQFLSEAILIEVIGSFTRVTETCYVNHLMHQSIKISSARVG